MKVKMGFITFFDRPTFLASGVIWVTEEHLRYLLS